MRRSNMIAALVLVILLVGMAALVPRAATAAPQKVVLTGVIENCWAGSDTFGKWHENDNNGHGNWKGMPEEWVALIGGQYYASRSVLKAEQYHYKADGTEQYHNAYHWLMYPGLDPDAATGYYEINGVADTNDSLPLGAPGFLESHGTGVGRGSLAGQTVHFYMISAGDGPSDLYLCPNPAETNWHGMVELEINGAP